MQHTVGDQENNRLVGDRMFRECVEHYTDPSIKNKIVIQSPIRTEKAGKNLAVEVFPLWIEYYKYSGALNRTLKIVVIGIEKQYQALPYYVSPCHEQNLWNRVEQLLLSKNIDYSSVPDSCSGKDTISIFFHGHGEENIKGLLGKITDYIRNGILMLQEGAAIEEVKEIFFTHAAAHLQQLQSRLGKYRPLLEYLPWEQEIEQLDKMIIAVESWLKQPDKSVISQDEILKHVKIAFESISQLMKIHKIK